MGKVDANVRYKSGKDRLQSSQEDSFQAHVKKVVELTNCSSEDAAYVLSEYDNNVDQAVIAIFDRPDENVWKENKRKIKKDNLEKENVHTSRRPTFGNRGRGDASTQDRRNFRDGQNSRFRPKGSQAPNKTEDSGRNGRPGRFSSGKNSNSDRNSREEKSRNKNEIDTFITTNDDDNNWKNGPLVFEPSVPPVSQLPPANGTAELNSTTPASSEMFDTPTNSASNVSASSTSKLSFAAVTAKKKPVSVPPSAPSVSSQSQQSTTFASAKLNSSGTGSVSRNASHNISAVSDTPTSQMAIVPCANKNEEKSSLNQTTSQQFSLLENSPGSVYTSTSYVPASSLNVNREFTDKLKNDIGLNAPSSTSLGSFSSGLPTSKDTLGSSSVPNRTVLPLGQTQPVQSNPISNYGIGIQSNTSGVEFLTECLSSKDVLEYNFGFSPVTENLQNHQQQQQQQTSKVYDTSSNSTGALSFTNTCCLDYRPNELKNDRNPTISNSFLNSSGSKFNENIQLTSQSQQSSSHSQQPQSVLVSAPHALSSQSQSQQHSTSTSLQQQPLSQQTHQNLSQPQPTQSSQHSLQQQQQQMYTTPFPYFINEQYSALAPFPYGINTVNQLDMQLSTLLPSAIHTGTSGPIGTAVGNSQASSGAPQNHQLSQQSSQPSSQIQQQQHRSSATDNKFQSQLQSGGSSNNGLPSLNGNVSIPNLGSASRSQKSGSLGDGSLINAANNASGVPPPPGFAPPGLHHAQNLQQLFQMPTYGASYPILLPGGLQQQSQQRQQPPQNHPGQQLYSLQNQLQQRTAAMDNMMSFLEINSNSNSNLQGLTNAPHHNSGGFTIGTSQGQHQPQRVWDNVDLEGLGDDQVLIPWKKARPRGPPRFGKRSQNVENENEPMNIQRLVRLIAPVGPHLNPDSEYFMKLKRAAAIASNEKPFIHRLFQFGAAPSHTPLLPIGMLERHSRNIQSNKDFD